MKAKTGRWWMIFYVFLLGGLILTCQPAFAQLQITGDPPSVVDQDALYEFTPTLTTGQGGNIKFELLNYPNWLTYNAETGKISGTPKNKDIGTYTGLTLTVTDDKSAFDSIGPFDITVNDINDPPTQVSDPPLANWSEDAAYNYTLVVDDIDDDTVSGVANQAPSWLSFSQSEENPFQFSLSGTPVNSDVGSHQIEIDIQDPRGGSYLFQFSITVNNVNDPPKVISNAPVTTAAEDAEYSHTIIVRDVDSGDNVEQNATILPSWLTLSDPTSPVDTEYHFILSGIPLNEHVGKDQEVKIIFTDQSGANTIFNPFLTVNNTNDPPEISGNPATSVFEDTAYSFSPQYSDIDKDVDGNKDNLSFTKTSTSVWPDWLIFNTNTGKLTGTPANKDVGIIEGIVITVSDGKAEVSLDAFNLEVKNTNDPPQISGQPQPAIEDSPYSFVPTAQDIDKTVTGEPADTLTFSIETGENPLPLWLEFDTATGELSSVDGPTNEDVGVISGLAITVTDDKGAYATLGPFDLTVQNTNDPPFFSGPPPSTQVSEDNPYLFTPVVIDEDVDSEGNPDTLTFTIEQKPEWAEFNTQTGELGGTPGNYDIGFYNNVIISVEDGKGGTASMDPFNIEVKAVNDPPIITGTPRPFVGVGGTYAFQPNAEDEDVDENGEKADTLRFNVTKQPAWTSFDIFTGLLSNKTGRPNSDDIGVYEDITITVFDQKGGTASLGPFEIEVKKAGDVNLIPGNIDGLGDIDLTDAIIGLQFLSNVEMTDQYLFIESDVNLDEKIGLEEVIFILRTVSQQ